MIEKAAGICYCWSVDKSYELSNGISDMEPARGVETFDFSTLNTNLDVIHDSQIQNSNSK